jgi:hypothetical protein
MSACHLGRVQCISLSCRYVAKFASCTVANSRRTAEVNNRRRKYGLNQMKEEKENLILKFFVSWFLT